MATQLETPMNKYYGNTVTTDFPISFEYFDKSYVKVYIKRASGLEELLDSSRYKFNEFDNGIVFPVLETDTVLGLRDVLVIKRETPTHNPYEFDNQRRLFPEETMGADDFASHQIQEINEVLKRALILDVTRTETPKEYIEYLDSIPNQLEQTKQEVNTALQNHTATINGKIEEARKWAVGTIEENSNGSAKYWAEQAKMNYEEALALADEINGEVI